MLRINVAGTANCPGVWLAASAVKAEIGINDNSNKKTGDLIATSTPVRGFFIL